MGPAGRRRGTRAPAEPGRRVASRAVRGGGLALWAVRCRRPRPQVSAGSREGELSPPGHRVPGRPVGGVAGHAGLVCARVVVTGRVGAPLLLGASPATRTPLSDGPPQTPGRLLRVGPGSAGRRGMHLSAPAGELAGRCDRPQAPSPTEWERRISRCLSTLQTHSEVWEAEIKMLSPGAAGERWEPIGASRRRHHTVTRALPSSYWLSSQRVEACSQVKEAQCSQVMWARLDLGQPSSAPSVPPCGGFGAAVPVPQGSGT